MDNKVLKEYMTRFSREKLKSYLGQDILESLLEWQNDDEYIFNKCVLAELIITINGLNILKEKNFRKDLLRTFEPEQILELKQLLPAKYVNITDLNELVDIISNLSWKKTSVTERLLQILEIDIDKVFNQKEEKELAVNTIQSYEKFYELLDYQYVIRQKALNKLMSGYEGERMLIHMPTGTGKTKTATHIICHHYNYNLNKRGLVIWIAHTNELLGQAYETFENVWKHLGNGKINVFKLWGEYDIDSQIENLDGIAFCSIQKLESIARKNTALYERLRKEARLIVYDEAHKASAPESRKLINDLMIKTGEDRALIGLSATPGREKRVSFDNRLLASTFGGYEIHIDTRLMNEVNYSRQKAINIKPEEDIIKYFQEKGVLAKIKKLELTYEEDISQEDLEKIILQKKQNGDIDFSNKSLEIIGKNKKRNLCIIKKLRELNDQKIPTIVFACSVTHAQLLSAMLKIEGIKNSLIIGDMPSRERAEAIKKFKDRENDVNIIINYEVLTTGFDSTNIKCVFITRPTQSIVLYSQMIGRGLRGPQMGGNEECLLIDVKDNLMKYNENMAFSHFDNYWKE